jgi:hypothetical protein
MKKVYFGNLGQFGDVIMQEPALRKYIKDNPDDKITLGVSLKYSEALKLYENYHDNIVAMKIFLDYENFPTEDDVRYFKNEQFDLVTIKRTSNEINISDRGCLALHPDTAWAKRIHQTAAAGHQQGIEIEDTQIRFNKTFDLEVKEKFICFSLFPNHPHAGAKSLSIQQIQGIVKMINKMGLHAVHLNGPNEPDIEGTIKSNCSWIDSVALMTRSEMLITADTGMSWAASAFSHPTIGLYASGYNPVCETSKNWQPVNQNASYLESYSAEGIKARDIIEEVLKKIKGQN